MPLETRPPCTAIDPSFNSQATSSEKYAIQAITAIIPAYNEAKSIGRIIDVLGQVECLDKIIIVDDGSTDGTFEAVQALAQNDRRMVVLRHASNRGKGQAVYTGWLSARTPYLLLLDADLIALTPQHIYDLVGPVLAGQADMTLGLFQEGHWNTDLSHKLTPWLTGQRCLRADLYSLVSPRAAEGYGLETALTVAAQQNGWRCQHIPWIGVTHLPSEVHRGFWKGFWVRIRMYANIVAAWILAKRDYEPAHLAGRRKGS